MIRWRAGRRLVVPEVRRVPEARQHDLVAVGQVRQQLAGRVLRRASRSRASPLISSVSTSDVRTRLYASSSGVGGPRVDQAAAGPEELGAGVAEDRAASPPAREVAARRRRRRRGRSAATSPHTCDVAGTRRSRQQRLQPEPARVAVGGRAARRRASSAPESGAAAGVDVHQAEERARAARCPRLIGRNPSGPGMSRGGAPHRRGQVAGPRAARRVLRAQRRRSGAICASVVARVPEEVAGRVDADHHRAVDAAAGGARRRSARCACRRSR